jgi:hypothetical protein
MATMRQLAAGYTLTLVAAGIFQSWFWERHADAQSRFRPDIWNSLFLAWTPLVLIAWMRIGQCHAGVALSARQLCVPGVARLIGISLAASAACTLLALLGPIYLSGGPMFFGLSALVFAICAGLLITLFGGTRWQLPIYFACFGFAICSRSATGFMQKFLGPTALTTALLTAWRLRALVYSPQTGSAGETLQYLIAGKWNVLAGWNGNSSESNWRLTLAGWWSTRRRAGEAFEERSRNRSPAAAFRAALGPLQASNEITTWLIAIATPIALSFLPHETVSELLRSPFEFVSFILALAGVGLVVARVRRLGQLLWNQHAEIADLALLPGLGDARCQGRALLREALILPSIYYALWFCGVTGSWLALARTVQAPMQSMLLLPQLMCSILMLFVTMSVGVLSGHLRRSSAWFKGLAYVPVTPAVFWIVSSQLWIFGLVSAPASPANLLTWQSFATVLIVGGMAVCLIAWGLRLSRKPNLLCR